MLSKEERMAIEHLKNYPMNWLIESVNESAIKIISNLIEKQSKEIEEYKKQLDLDYVKNNYTSNDKIKAKIEELKKNKDFDEDVYVEEFTVDILQSLLEKE